MAPVPSHITHEPTFFVEDRLTSIKQVASDMTHIGERSVQGGTGGVPSFSLSPPVPRTRLVLLGDHTGSWGRVTGNCDDLEPASTVWCGSSMAVLGKVSKGQGFFSPKKVLLKKEKSKEKKKEREREEHVCVTNNSSKTQNNREVFTARSLTHPSTFLIGGNGCCLIGRQPSDPPGLLVGWSSLV